MSFRSIVLSGAVFASILGVTPHALQLSNFVSPAEAQNISLDFSVFYDGMRDDGDWVNYDGRYVFVPAGVEDNWRPYTRGHWSHTRQYGWVWISDERFGWATYHYGRWGYARDIGWYWVPGRRWAPAWVSWRRSAHHVAWAPLPPSAYEDDDYSNVDSHFNVTLAAQPSYFWVSVSAGDFQISDLRSRIIIDAQENQRIYDRSHFEGPVIIQNNTVINNVINVNFIQQQTGKPVQNVNVQTTTDPTAAKSQQASQPGSITAFQGAIAVAPDVKPADVKPLEQVQQKMASKPKLPVPDTAKPAVPPVAGTVVAPPAPGASPTLTPKPGQAVVPPVPGAAVTPAKPVDNAATPPKAGDVVPPAKPGVTTVPVKPDVAVPPVKPADTTIQPKTNAVLPPAVSTAPPKVDNSVKPKVIPVKPDAVLPKPELPVIKSAPIAPPPPAPPIVKVAPVQPQLNKTDLAPQAPPAVNKPQTNVPASPPPHGAKVKKPGEKLKPCVPPDGQKDCAPPKE